jgi:hypothetical protein
MRRYGHPDALPEAARALFASEAKDPDSFYATAGWYRVVVAHAMPVGASACFAVAGLGNDPDIAPNVAPDVIPGGLFPLLHLPDGGWQSLTTPYTCLHRPLFRDDISAIDLENAGRALAGFCRGGLRLEALDPDWPCLDGLLRGLRRGGLVALRFDQFGNWYEAVLDWPSYLAGREGALRETIRRRSARASRDPRITLELFRDPAGLDRGISAFEDVYRRSWKEPEPYPSFNAALMRLAADQGVLRLGVMWQDGPGESDTGEDERGQGERAIAVQYWVLTGAVACVLKLAHDEAARALSPGTVLTAWMIQGMLAEGPVRALDFGRGDDAYKQGWAGVRRQRIGFLLVDPRSLFGFISIARHRLGLIRRRLKGG